jgi:hypothetical protein
MKKKQIPSGKVGCVLLFHDTSSSSFSSGKSVFFLFIKYWEGGYFNFKVLVSFLCVAPANDNNKATW